MTDNSPSLQWEGWEVQIVVLGIMVQVEILAPSLQ